MRVGNAYPGNIHLDHLQGRLFLENGGSTGALTANAGEIFTPSEFQPVHSEGLKLAPSVTYRQNILDVSTIGYGQMIVSGTVALGGATLVVAAQTPYRRGSKFLIIDNDGHDAVNGTFHDLPEKARFLPVALGASTPQPL
jgi:hypothetical protein